MRRSIRNLAENVEKCPYSPTSSPNTPPRTFSEIPGPREIPVIGNIGYFKYAVKSGEFSVILLNIFYLIYIFFFLDAKTIENYNQHLEEMYKKYGKIVKENLGFGRKYVVHIFDPGS